MTTPDKMSPAQIVMLCAGIVLFLVAVGLLIYLVKQKKPFTAVIA